MPHPPKSESTQGSEPFARRRPQPQEPASRSTATLASARALPWTLPERATALWAKRLCKQPRSFRRTAFGSPSAPFRVTFLTILPEVAKGEPGDMLYHFSCSSSVILFVGAVPSGMNRHVNIVVIHSRGDTP